MYRNLQFFGSHGLNFDDFDDIYLRKYIILTLRAIPIPEDLSLMAYNYIRKLQTPADNLSNLMTMDNWYYYSIPGLYGEPNVSDKKNHKHLTVIGIMGMNITFTQKHILLPSYIRNPSDFYSPFNTKNVLIHRNYFKALINAFSGDHALYVDAKISNKYYISDFSLKDFEQSLIEKYGKSDKTLFDYKKGKYPNFYIDDFAI